MKTNKDRGNNALSEGKECNDNGGMGEEKKEEERVLLPCSFMSSSHS